MCERVGADEVGDFRASSLSTLTQMVASGIGVTLLPSLAADVEVRSRRSSVVIPFAGKAPCRRIGLAWRRTSPRGDEFKLLGELLRPTKA